jgi:hypothetical protein
MKRYALTSGLLISLLCGCSSVPRQPTEPTEDSAPVRPALTLLDITQQVRELNTRYVLCSECGVPSSKTIETRADSPMHIEEVESEPVLQKPPQPEARKTGSIPKKRGSVRRKLSGASQCNT